MRGSSRRSWLSSVRIKVLHSQPTDLLALLEDRKWNHSGILGQKNNIFSCHSLQSIFLFAIPILMCNYNCETFQNSLQQFQLSLCYIVCDKRFVIIISLPESHRGLSSESPVLMKDPVVVRIAEEKKKSPAQVLLKYSMQRDVIVLPKSVNESRIVSNFEVIKFSWCYW